MKIVPNQTFLHERDRYEPDQEYDVDDADGVYFIRAGWANEPGADATPGSADAPVDLDVHDAVSNQEA